MSVLSESPSSTLGQLIFDKGVHPQRLEALMGISPTSGLWRFDQVLLSTAADLASPHGKR